MKKYFKLFGNFFRDVIKYRTFSDGSDCIWDKEQLSSIKYFLSVPNQTLTKGF